MTKADARICGLTPREAAVLFHPQDYGRDDDAARSLFRNGLISWDGKTEEFGRTPQGDARRQTIIECHRLELRHDAGGPRWHVEGKAIHCGDSLELLVGSGWLPVRFEVEWMEHQVHSGDARRDWPAPALYLDTPGGSLVGKAMHPKVNSPSCMFRWPRKDGAQ